MFAPWVSVLFVLSILAGLMLLLREYQHRHSPHPEWVRKLLHVGMGLVTLSFPWLFDSPLPAIGLAMGAIAFLCSIKFIPYFHQRLGSVTDGVARSSWGEVYFPFSVALVFTLSQGNWVYYLIPMLLLTLGDAVAALIGVSYGLHTYSTSEGHKSAEGSIAFFTVAFLSTHVPLLLLTETGRAESLLIAVILGLQVMVLEAISWQGLDNVFIPIGGLIMLKLFLPMDIPSLSFRLILTLIVGILTLNWRHRTTLNDSAVLGSAWFGYLTWVLADWRWFIAPVILFFAYSLLCPWTQQYQERRHDMRAVLSIGSTGILWLLLGKIMGETLCFYPYTLAFAAHLAIIDIAVPRFHPQLPNWRFIGRSVVKGWVLIFVPFLWIQGWDGQAIAYAGEGFIIMGPIAIVFALLQGSCRNLDETWMWIGRSAIVALGSAISLNIWVMGHG
ncbi:MULTISPECIES: hypothetical protein [unclassified Roseofilum]|uniref:diacylglycerol/polyprenol kinase family protein n=1 Tax=unclassified Roseofilum TaxID=2620099 RepID=UPI001B1B7523|nr:MULTISPECIES: hypothetical protein [unclassified Roseofilum]MBP0008008.1 hypothetical protein [Roseofilum sp. Belize Diploria]MBP0033353.1 hypothetical protein [Roseofilum sp. Belize BBD 4]